MCLSLLKKPQQPQHHQLHRQHLLQQHQHQVIFICLLNDLIRKFITNFLLGEVTQSSSEEATPRSTGLKVVYALVPIFVVAGTLILLDCQKNWRWSRKIYQTFSTWLPQNRKQEQQGNDEDPEVVPLQQ